MNDYMLSDEMMRESKSTTLRDYLSVVFHYKYIAIGTFLLLFIGISFFVLFKQDLYKSESLLLVTPGWEDRNLDPLSATGDEQINIIQPLTRLLNSTLEIIKSKDLAKIKYPVWATILSLGRNLFSSA